MVYPFVPQLCICFSTTLPVASTFIPTGTPHTTVEFATHEQTRLFLAKLGINSESACAAGVSPQDVAAFFESAAGTLDTLRPSLDAAELSVSSARADLASLRTRASLAPDSSPDAAIQQGEQALQAALIARALLENSAFETATASLPQAVRSGLTTIRLNKGRCVPVEYKLVSHTNEEWAALLEAQRHIGSRRACGLAAEPEQASIIASAEADPTVAVGRNRIQTTLSQVSSVWIDTTEQP